MFKKFTVIFPTFIDSMNFRQVDAIYTSQLVINVTFQNCKRQSIPKIYNRLSPISEFSDDFSIVGDYRNNTICLSFTT